MIYTNLVRRDFGPLEDYPVRPGSPIYDHTNKTITVNNYVSSSSPVLAQNSADILNNINAMQMRQQQDAIARRQPIVSYASAKNDLYNRVVLNTQAVGAFNVSYGGTRAGGTTYSHKGYDPTGMYGEMASDYGQSYDWGRASFNNVPGQRWSMVKYDMGGQAHYMPLAERASGYQDRHKALFAEYTAGRISDNALFHGAMRENVLNDRDEILSDYDYTSGLNAYARATITFGGKSGRISFSNTFGSGGTSYRYF